MPDASPAMMELSSEDLSLCRSEKALRPACPTRVPEARVEEGFFQRTKLTKTATEEVVFNAEWGAPYRNSLNEQDRPPRFLHLVVHGGDLSQAFEFTPKSQGERTWGGRKGELLLAPPYPRGGIDGAHLMFQWTEGERHYVVSMHAWEPLDEAERYLEETVSSILR